MSVTELAQNFKSKLYKYFPSRREISLRTEDAFLILSFIGVNLKIEKNTPSALEILLNKAINILEAMNSRIMNNIQNERDKKVKEFRDSCIRQQKNSEQASLVASKVTFFNNKMNNNNMINNNNTMNDNNMMNNNNTMNDKSIKKPALSIKTVPDNDNIKDLLDILNDNYPNEYNKIDMDSFFNNNSSNLSTINPLNDKSDDLLESSSFIKILRDPEVSLSQNTLNSSISTDYCIVDNNNSQKYFSDSTLIPMYPIFTQDSSIHISSSLCEVIPESNICLKTNGTGNRLKSDSNNNSFFCEKSKFIQFKENASNFILKGLLTIRNLDRILKKAKSRKLFDKKGIVFDDISIINNSNTATMNENIGFNIFDSSMVDTSYLNSTMQSSAETGFSNSSFNSKSKEDSFVRKVSLENTYNSENMQPSKILKKNENTLKSVDSILEGFTYKNIEFSRLFDENRISNQKQASDAPKSKFINRSKNEDIKLPATVIPNQMNDYIASLDTSIILDNKKESKEMNKFSSSNVIIKNTKEILDSSEFKRIIIECKNQPYSSIEIVRRFCLHYNLCFPEFEIVRENDVFRCTATFLDVNFVSGYEYDKTDSKNDACKKVLEYISRNWEKIFENKIVHRM